LPGPKKIKEAKLCHKPFQKGQTLKNEKGQIKAKFDSKIYQNSKIQYTNFIKYFMFCSDFYKRGLKICYLFQHKKAKRWPNGQNVLFLSNRLEKGQMATMLPPLFLTTEQKCLSSMDSKLGPDRKDSYFQENNSQNFLRKFVIFFLTFRCFYKAIIHYP